MKDCQFHTLARNSKMYDTLMQMCRWFGYRPNYKDLCKVFLPEESLEWYVFISNAINELYRELERMRLQEKTPSDFGLKVRDHPGSLLVTSRNKMYAAQSTIHKVDLWGSRQRRFRFYNDDDINNRNINMTGEFIRSIQSNETLQYEDRPSVIYLDVPHNIIIKYINDMILPEDDLGNKALIKFIEVFEREDLPMFRVCIRNQIRVEFSLVVKTYRSEIQ